MARSKSVSKKELLAFRDLKESKKKKDSVGPLMPGIEGDEEEESNELTGVDFILNSVGGASDDNAPFDSKALMGLRNNLLSKRNMNMALEATGKKTSTDKGNIVNKIVDFGDSLEESKAQGNTLRDRMTASGTYAGLVQALDQYINSHNPWTKLGKQRLAIVKAFRWQAGEERKLLSMEINSNGGTVKEFMFNAVDSSRLADRSYNDLDESQNKLLFENFRSKYGLTDKDMEDIRNNMARINAYNTMITGNDSASVEVIENIAKNYKLKKKYANFNKEDGDSSSPSQRISSAARDEGRECVEEAKIYARDRLGVDLTKNILVDSVTGRFGRFNDALMQIGHDDKTKEANARLLIDLCSKNDSDRVFAFKRIIHKWLNIDLSNFDNRDPMYVIENYTKLQRLLTIGFVYKSDVTEYMSQAAGIAIEPELADDLTKLAFFYQELNKYYSSVMDSFAGGLYTDFESFGALQDKATEEYDGSNNNKGISEYIMSNTGNSAFKNEDIVNLGAILNTAANKLAVSKDSAKDYLEKNYNISIEEMKEKLNYFVKADDSKVSDTKRKQARIDKPASLKKRF